jgi:N utilization substance protein A
MLLITSNIQLYITSACPAKSSIKINEETKRAEVFLKLEEVSKAQEEEGTTLN